MQKAHERILPVFYNDNYLSLLPGESRHLRIESSVTNAEPLISVDGWNIEAEDLH